MSLYHRFRNRFGTAGVVVAVIALVMAMVTGAYAAGGGLSGKQKKEVKKIAKSEAQKYANSNPGAEGKQGPAGTNGTNGKDGANGKDGSPGAPGAPGAPGKSVISEEVEPGNAECEAGGYSFEVEESGETNFVCNGSAGSGGGSGTLESGEEETGVWSLFIPTEFTIGYWSIQYPRPLRELPEAIFLKTGVTTSECPGSFEHPKANPETTKPALCVYPNPELSLPAAFPVTGLSLTSGIVWSWYVEEETKTEAWGSWAVKAP